jgi:hypothetical protein
MENLYKRLTELLGKRHSDPAFKQLEADLGEEADKPEWSNPFAFYNSHKSVSFLKAGFWITFNWGTAEAIYCVIDTPSTRDGLFGAFKALPYGIAPGDSVSAVRNKFDAQPLSSSGPFQTYLRDSIYMVFEFNDDKISTLELRAKQ